MEDQSKQEYNGYYIPTEIFTEIKLKNQQLWTFINLIMPYANGSLLENFEPARRELQYQMKKIGRINI